MVEVAERLRPDVPRVCVWKKLQRSSRPIGRRTNHSHVILQFYRPAAASQDPTLRPAGVDRFQGHTGQSGIRFEKCRERPCWFRGGIKLVAGEEVERLDFGLMGKRSVTIPHPLGPSPALRPRFEPTSTHTPFPRTPTCSLSFFGFDRRRCVQFSFSTQLFSKNSCRGVDKTLLLSHPLHLHQRSEIRERMVQPAMIRMAARRTAVVCGSRATAPVSGEREGLCAVVVVCGQETEREREKHTACLVSTLLATANCCVNVFAGGS